MASLREFPIVIRQVGVVKFLKRIWFEIGDDNLFTWASALAYSWLFAIFPFFLTLLSIIPLLKHEWRMAAQSEIIHTIHQLPHDASKTVEDFVSPKLEQLLFNKETKSITSLLSVGLLVTLWAASGGMNMTMAALDRAYDVPRSRPFYHQRPLAITLTCVVAGLILAVIILVPVGTLVTNYVVNRTDRLLEKTGMTQPMTPLIAPATATHPTATVPATQHLHRMRMEEAAASESRGAFIAFLVLWHVFRFGLSFMFLFWVVALVYHFGPNVKQRFRLLSPGSVFSVGAWSLLAATFRFYVDTFGKYGQTYGTVGGVIILLFFFYLDALVLLVGAEINAEVDAGIRTIEHERAKPPPPAETKDTVPAIETP